MTNVPGATEIIQTAETLSKQEHSVFLIVILIVLGIALAFLLRFMAKYFMRQYDALIIDHKEARQHYHDSLKTIVTENHMIMKELGVKMAQSTDAINACMAFSKMVHEKLLRP